MGGAARSMSERRPGCSPGAAGRESINVKHRRRGLRPLPFTSVDSSHEKQPKRPPSRNDHGEVLVPECPVRTVDSDWRRNAACTGEDPELFFPIGSAGPAARQTQQARQVCQGCPVRLACLEWALQVGADYGVWGGMSEDDRQSLRRRSRSTRASRRVQPPPATAIPPMESRLRTANAARALPRLP